MADRLPAAVASVLNQDHKNVELIIVDDGSKKSVNSNKLSIPDEIEHFIIHSKHSGKPKAVNQGFEIASGDYLVILDADDELTKSSLSDRLQKLRKQQADLCIGSFETRYQGKRQRLRTVERFRKYSKQRLISTFLLRIISPFHQNSMMFSSRLLKRVGGMNPKMMRSQDKDFAIRLIQQANRIVFLETSTYIYNRYARPFNTRIFNRCVGIKYLLQVTYRNTSGWQRSGYLTWISLVQIAKLFHDLFGVYKR